MTAQGLGGPPIDALVTGARASSGRTSSTPWSPRRPTSVVLDDLSTGLRDNVNPNAELVEGSIGDADSGGRGGARVARWCSIWAAHGAVAAFARATRSVIETRPTCTGTLTVLTAAPTPACGACVFASSSSVYGGAEIIPTPESGAAAAPLALRRERSSRPSGTCRVFAELSGLETVALRYFNVFGPRQRPDSTYTAVIPLFTDALLRNERADGARRRRPEPRLHVCGRRGGRQPRRRAAPAEMLQQPRVQRGARRHEHAARVARHPRRAHRQPARAGLRRARAGDVRRSQADAERPAPTSVGPRTGRSRPAYAKWSPGCDAAPTRDPRSGRRLTYL